MKLTTPRALALAGVLVLVIAAVVGCGGAGLSGKYSDPMKATTWTFEGNGTFTMTMSGLGESVKGQYKLDGTKLTLTPDKAGAETMGTDDATGTVSEDRKTITLASGVVVTLQE